MRSTRSVRCLAGALAAVTVAGGIVAGVLAGQWQVPASAITMTAGIAVTFTPMAALVLAGSPGHPVGRLMAAAGASCGIDVLAAAWSGWTPMAWLTRWAWLPSLGLIFLSLLVFPDGKLPSPRWRPLAVTVALATTVSSAALAVAAYDHPRALLTADVTLTPRAHTCLLVTKVAIVVACGGLLGALWSLGLRWLRATGDLRRQLACLLPAALLLLLALVLDAMDIPGFWLLVAVVVPVAMTIAVLRFHLYDLDQIVNRSAVWLLMSLFVIVTYTMLTSRFVDVLLGSRSSVVSVVVTGAVGVVLEPVHRRVQHGVNRLLYGDSSDPYKVVTRLGTLLRETAEPHAALHRLAESIATSLLVPHVAVEITSHEGTRVAVAHGERFGPVEYFDMTAHGEHIGRLVVARRSSTDRFSRRERRLLQGVAIHAAMAAKTARLIQDLQDSRERLVTARETERRRLRHDLHDGVGPALSGMSMQLRVAQQSLSNRDRMDSLLRTLGEDLRGCLGEIRRIVDQLRPAVLDDGLVAALRAECRRFDGSALKVDLSTGDDLDELPPAVEVAAYRIVAEALTNVARHAEATNCRITIRPPQSSVTRPSVLSLDIADDGVGMAPSARHHVGLDSMRERAEELGGTFTITERPSHGTLVQVRLPVVMRQPGRRAAGEQRRTASICSAP